MKNLQTFEEFVNENNELNEEKKSLPKFKDIPAWAKYVAQHSDGEWWFYEGVPTMLRYKNGGGGWKNDDNQLYSGITTDGSNWDKIPTYYYVKNGKVTESINESFDEPGYTPHKLKNSRLVMKTRDELYYMQRHQLEKLLDQVNKVKHKLEDKYNKEQEGHNRFSVTDSLSADLTYLRSYAKIINYFL